MKYNDRGDLITNERYGQCIPAKQVRIIRHNYANGIKYPEVSPMYHISREELAFIVTHEPPSLPCA